MRHTLDFVDDPDGVIVHLFGRADVAGFHALNQLLLDPRFRSGMQILVDHTHLDASQLTMSDIDQIGSYALTLRGGVGPGPIAVVAPDILNRLAAQAISYRTGSTVYNPQYFETLAEGFRWLAQQHPSA
jgi:hypothetical protein